MTEPAPRKLMVSPKEAAAMVSVDRDTIFKWIKQGKLPATKLSRRIIRIRLADLEALIERSAA